MSREWLGALAGALAIPESARDLWRGRRSWWVVVGLVVALGVLVRAFWYVTGDLDGAFQWHGYPILTSTDAYFFAAGVGDLTSSAWGDGVLRLAEGHQHGLVALGALLVGGLGIAAEAVFTWLPPVLGALVVVPVAVLGRTLGGPLLGAAAGLGAAFAPAHVARTTIGYFDTDVFAVTTPLMAVALMLSALERRADTSLPRSAVAAAFVLAAYPFLYDQGNTVALALVLAFGGWVWWSARGASGSDGGWGHRALALFALALLAWPVWFTLPVVGIAVLALPHLPKWRHERWVALGLLVLVIATGPAARSLYRKLEIYGGAKDAAALVEAQGEPDLREGDWGEVDTTGLVSEARRLPLEVMFAKTAGHWVVFWVGAVGLLLLCFARPTLLIAGPLVALGLFAFVGGHRFLIYLAPLVALGVAYVAVRISVWAPTSQLRVAVVSLSALALFVPSALATMTGAPPTVMVRGEVEVLEALGKRAARTDTTVAWWDYGYPTVYHARTRTLADGSRRAEDASIVAEILMTPSVERAVRLARWAAAAERSTKEGAASVLVTAAKERGLRPSEWLGQVEAGSWRGPRDLPAVGEIWLYLPLRLLPAVPALELFRPTDEGQRRRPPFIKGYRGVRSEGRRLILADGLEVDSGAVVIRRRNANGTWAEKPLAKIYSVSGAGSDRDLKKKEGMPSARTAGVLLRDLGLFVECETALLESFWGRLALLGDVPPGFELALATPGARVYRLPRPTAP